MAIRLGSTTVRCYAWNGGGITIGNGAIIKHTSTYDDGVAYTEDRNVYTTAITGAGIWARGNASKVAVGNNASISTMADTYVGGRIDSGSSVSLGAGSFITTSGDRAAGVDLSGSSSFFTAGDGLTITTSGHLSSGLNSSNGTRAQKISLGAGTTIRTSSLHSHALYTGGSTAKIGDNLTAETPDVGAHGVMVSATVSIHI